MYNCDFCEMYFHKKENLNKHLRAKHNSEKPFNCEVCYMQFSCSDELSRHSAVHSGSNLFSCEYCNQRFPTAMAQINHLYVCKAVDRVSSCGSDSDMVLSEAESIEQEQSDAEQEVSCEACLTNLSKADIEDHVSFTDSVKTSVKNACDVEENLHISSSCSGSVQSKDVLNEQCENILCAFCKATLSEADLINHYCTNDNTDKLFLIGGEVYHIESIKTAEAEMLVDENASEECLQHGNQILSCETCHVEYEVSSSSKAVHECSLQSKTDDFQTAGDDHEPEVLKTNEDSQTSSAAFNGEDCDEAVSEDNSPDSFHEDAVDFYFSDKDSDNKDSVNKIKDSDTIAIMHNFAEKYNKNSSSKNYQKVNVQLFDQSNKAVACDKDNQIVEVIIVEPKSSNAYHEYAITDEFSICSESADVENDPEYHSDSVDLNELGVEACSNSDQNSHLGPSTFACPNCPSAFKIEHNLTRHLKDVHFEDIVECKFCKMSFTTRQTMKEHLQNAHVCSYSDSLDWSEELNDDCDFDNETIKPPRSKKENKQTFSCNFCSKQFSHLSGFKSHMSFFHLNEDDPGVCSKCDQIIDGEEPHKCPTECKVCGKTFSASYLKQHMNSHFGLKPFTCPECPMVFSHKNNLTRHLKNIHSEGHRQCKHCEMFFSTKHMLNAHCQQAHASKASYQCEDCGMGPMRYLRYLKHKKLFHGGSGQTFPCPFCEKICLDGKTFKEHLKSHESKTSECLDSSKVLQDQKSFARHVKQSIAKYFKCTQCDKSFSANSHLRAHLRIHTGEKPFKCQECGRAFTQMGNLSHHMQIHMGKQPCPSDECFKPFPHKCSAKHRISRKSFDCTLCEKSFSSSTQLKNHVRVHTGEKPHKCQECGKGFAQRGTLLYHLRTHANERPYSCSQCRKSFIRRGYLNSHKCSKARSS